MDLIKILRVSITFCIINLISACSSLPEGERSDIRDPYENTNRKIFAFNMNADTYLLEPAARGYQSNVPDAGRKAIDNHLNWAGMPSTALNSTFQGDYENAALATIHFAINGLTLGLADLTENSKVVEKRDFGQTLARAKVPDGYYLMVPLLGSHSTRSLVGRVVDRVTNPLSFINAGNMANNIRSAQIPVAAVAFRANNFEAFNDVKYNSIDSYARSRSLYYQVQARSIGDRTNQNKSSITLDNELDAFFDEPK